MKRATMAAILAGMLTFACGGEEETPAEEPATEEPAAEETAEAVEEPAAEDPTADEVPIPADFEAEAEAQITADNYEAELDSLAAEIEADTE